MNKVGRFGFSAPRNVLFGEGEHERVSEILKSRAMDLRGGRTLVLTDDGIGRTGIPEAILQRIRSEGFTADFVDSVPREPSDKDLDRMVAEISGNDIRCIVGVGGGSVLDTAKFLSVLLKYGGTIASLTENGVPGPGILCVMVPTTAGTGSEATPNAIVALTERKLKVGVVSPFFMPDHVILDPLMTRSLPPSITAATGVDAYCHVLECFTSKKANPFSDLVALEGIRLVDGAIRRAFTNGDDMAARSEMLLGSYYGGLAIASSGTTAVHALSYPLGGRFRIPHGVSNAILLVPVMDFNKDAIVEKLVAASRICGLPGGSSGAVTADRYIEHLRDMIHVLGIPSSMTEFGVPPDAIPELTEAAYQVRRLLDNNPKNMSSAEIEAIYRSIQ